MPDGMPRPSLPLPTVLCLGPTYQAPNMPLPSWGSTKMTVGCWLSLALPAELSVIGHSLNSSIPSHSRTTVSARDPHPLIPTTNEWQRHQADSGCHSSLSGIVLEKGTLSTKPCQAEAEYK